MALTFVSSIPSTGSVDYFINRSLEIVFNEALNQTTINNSTVYLYDLTAQINVPINVSRKSTDYNAIVIDPVVSLRENTSYRLTIVGQDLGLGIQLEAENLDKLSVSVQILFDTGDNVYSIDTTIQKEAQTKTLEGDLFLPVNIKALGYEFVVSSVRPENHAHGLTGNITGVTFNFSKNLLTGQDPSTWATVGIYPILQDSTYLASGTTMDLGSNSISIPPYSISATGSTLSVSFSYPLPRNTAISIELNSNIRSTDNDQYGGNLKYSSTTELYPNVYGPEVVKNELPAISHLLTNDYISTLLFKNSIWLWERLGRSLDFSSLPFAAKKYILLTTVLDLIEDKDYKKFVIAGTRRQLGDLNVSVDNLIGRIAMKAARVQKERDIAFETLVKGWQFKVGTISFPSSQFFGNRLWYDISSRYTDPVYRYYQPDLPIANIAINRQANTVNPIIW